MGQLWIRPLRGALLVAVTCLAAGCESQLKENSSFLIENFISGVTDASGTVQATLVLGDLPEAGGGPTSTVAGIAMMINGGSSQQTVTGGAQFTRVVFGVRGLRNYYELTLPGNVASQGILISSNPTVSFGGNLGFQYAVGDGTGIGAYSTQSVRFLRVGTGDIQISVAWDDSSDVDLHVIDPNGEEVYFAHKIAASGGELDLDANAACSPNEISPRVFYSNENVVWATGEAIPGTYKVILDYWSACGVASTDYVVTIQRTGAAAEIHTGSFVGAGAPQDTVSVFGY